MKSYFDETTQRMGYQEADYPEPSQAYDEPTRTISSRLMSLEEQLEKLGMAVDTMRSDIDRLKGAIG